MFYNTHLYRKMPQYQIIAQIQPFPNLPITRTKSRFLSSVEHYNSTPKLSNYPIFRTNFRFPGRFKKSGFQCILIVLYLSHPCVYAKINQKFGQNVISLAAGLQCAPICLHGQFLRVSIVRYLVVLPIQLQH